MNDDNDRNPLIDFFTKINDLPKEVNPYTEQLLKDLTDIESKLKKFDLTIKVLSVNPKIIKFGYTLEFNGDFWGKNEKLNLDSYNSNTKNKLLETLKNKILEEINNLETFYRSELEDKLGKLNEDVETLIGELDNID